MALSKLTDIRKSLSVEVEDLQVNGITTFTNSVSIGGTLTYQDVTNIDSVGLITARSGINVSGGDVTIPDSIIHLGDTNTKIRFPANDTISLETAGSERLRVASTGNVSIGNNDTPDTLLHLQGDKPKLRVESTNTLEASAGTEEIGRIEFEGTKGSNRNVAASLRVRQDGTWSTVDDWFSPTAIEFYTQDQSGTEITAPRFIINRDGDVGINTSNPTVKLDISEDKVAFPSAAGSTLLRLRNSAGSATLSIDANAGNASAIQFGDTAAASQGAVIYNHSSNHLQFNTGGDERLRIDSAGNVGVGTNVASDTTGNCQAFKIARLVNGQVRLIIQNHATGFANGAGFHQGIDGANVFIENRSDGGYIDFATINSSTYASRLRISSEGFVTKPYQAMFEAGGNNTAFSAQSPLPYPSVKYNIGNCYNNSTYKFTAPVNGYYQVMAHVIPTDYTAGGNNVELYVIDNHGTRYFLDRKLKSNNYSSNNFSVGGTRIIYADATDTLWLQFHAISGTPKVETASYFSIMLVA